MTTRIIVPVIRPTKSKYVVTNATYNKVVVYATTTAGAALEARRQGVMGSVVIKAV